MLGKFFRETKSDSLEALRAAVAENDIDRQKHNAIAGRAAALLNELHAAGRILCGNLTYENAKAYVDAKAASSATAFWQEAHAVCAPSVDARIVERTREPLLSALRDLEKSLGDELAGIELREQALQASLELKCRELQLREPPSDKSQFSGPVPAAGVVESPALAALRFRLKRCRSCLRRLTDDFGAFNPQQKMALINEAVDFCLK